jgi:hypothetical protein
MDTQLNLEMIPAVTEKMTGTGIVGMRIRGWFATKIGWQKNVYVCIVGETEKAYNVVDLQQRKAWIPKSLVKVAW